MQVVNIVEKMAWDKLDTVLNSKENICKCEKCRADMIAYALNKLKPRYVSTERGEVFVRAQYMDVDLSAAILVALTEAVEVVGKNPHHDKE
ncbi:late competence development ComFB family protein [Thermosyntropha sp.]|uniref:late competence development ComFB family protein n=1 Tax=Thermosyntropha sp. TaxID=2740820 RepID=UPI0025D6D031|nr:late competence development ComFB family protein [Thermosyntropha sp.]MBO8158126.1 late competence development ComFB family protein [Thermosyntropha sp.]